MRLRLMLIVVVAFTATACLSTSPTVPVTPANQAQVSTCESVGTLHNDIVLGGYVLGGSTSALGGVSALESATNAKNALAISAAIVGAIGVVDTAFIAFTGQEYAANQCPSVTGVLPLGVKRYEASK